MFCRYCGNTLEPDSVFCEKCGKQVKKSENNETANTTINNSSINSTRSDVSVRNTKPTIRKDRMRVNYPYRDSSFGLSVIQAVLCISAIIFILLVLTDNIPLSSFPSKTAGTIKVFLSISLLYFSVMFIIKIVKANAIKKTHLSIENDGVYGVGGTQSYLSVEDVIIRYEDITQVTTRGGLLIICTLGKYYKFLIDNNESAANIIMSRLRSRR